MSIVPRPHDDGAPPHAVAHLRDVVRDSRVFRWIKGHRNLSAAVAAILVLLKIWRWLVFDLVRWVMHPGATASWVGEHWVPVVVGSAGIFLVAFVVTRLGIDWFSEDDVELGDWKAVSTRAGRPYETRPLPPRIG